jgi:hypothetical protein
MGMAFHAKTGIEIDALDMNALVHDHARGEQRIEATGNQSNGFILFAHDSIGSRFFSDTIVHRNKLKGTADTMLIPSIALAHPAW